LVITCGGQDISVITSVEEVIIPEKVVVEYIIQPMRPESLDVLAIVDTSCSMADNFDELGSGLEILKDDIRLLTDDFTISFINSSLVGRYYSGPYDDSSNAIDLLLAPYALTGDNAEVAFQSLYQFVDMPEADYALRPGADKLFIFISDEEEQSQIPVAMFRDWLISYNEDVQHDIVTISITENSTCGHVANDIGTRYNELSNFYGKNYIDICSDWSTALADSSFILNLKNYLNLKYIPVEESLTVSVDGEETNLWYYLSSTNTVYFDFNLTEGSIVTIGYNTF
tara:strand:+ start:1191 stop:2042 length:852 start_codon:yes stop_codon:yes gene_type:complete